MKNYITNLEELEIEQKKLEITMDLTRQEFTKSLKSSGNDLKDYALKNVALPAGALGIGAVALNKFSHNSKDKPSSESSLFDNKLIALLLPILPVIFKEFILPDKESEEPILSAGVNMNKDLLEVSPRA